MKNSSILILFIAAVFSAHAQTKPDVFAELNPEARTFAVYIGAYDWGACVEKFVVNTGKNISPDSVRAEDFTIRRIMRQTSSNIGLLKGELTITDAFASDALGNVKNSPTKYITILTDVHPDAENSDPFVSITLADHLSGYYGYKIENETLDIQITRTQGIVNENAALFTTEETEFTLPLTEKQIEKNKKKNIDIEKKLTMNVAHYIPPEQKTSGKKIPLILWFHGSGEGGKDINQVLLKTKAACFATEHIQSHFENGAAVLIPQCPTNWFETTEQNSLGIRYWAPVDKNAPIEAIRKPLKQFLEKIITVDEPEPEQKEEIPFAAVSYYSTFVKEILDTFLKNHPEIDSERIYVGGCSSGGYMTINMILQYPGFFAAAFPVSEYYLDSKIMNSQIEILKEIPLWFVYTKNDETVSPEKNTAATFARLERAGHQNLHISAFENAQDTSGKFLKNREADKDDDDYNLPYEYDSHYSWIYVFNDECTDGTLNLFDWLSEQNSLNSAE